MTVLRSARDQPSCQRECGYQVRRPAQSHLVLIPLDPRLRQDRGRGRASAPEPARVGRHAKTTKRLRAKASVSIP